MTHYTAHAQESSVATAMDKLNDLYFTSREIETEEPSIIKSH